MPTASAFWITGASRGEIRDETLPLVTENDVRVEAQFSAVSRGTEALVYQQRVPPSEWQRMRAPHQSGAWPGPVKYGYASVGTVIEGPAALRGRRVFALHPHQTSYVLPGRAVVPLPDDVPSSRAVLAANMETALNAIWDGSPLPGQRIVVIGAGVIGALVAYLAGRIIGCEVTLVDTHDDRRALAQALGVRFSGPHEAAAGADLIFHASGSPAGLTRALALAGDEACIVELSWYGTSAVSLPLGESFHARRLTLRSSQVGRVAANMRARWDAQRRLALALSLLADSTLDALFSGESAFEQLPQTMDALCSSESRALCHRVRYGGPACSV